MQTSFEAARDAVLAALVEFAEQTPGGEGLWLQGSLARGDADAFSDIDAYLAIGVADFDAVWGGRGALLERLGGALAWSDGPAPGLTAVHALMAGGARLDLFFEKASAASGVSRPVAKALVDKTGLVAGFKLDWQASTPAVGRIIQTIIRMTRHGATWPLRVLGRGRWGTLAKIELHLINAQIAQLMAVAHDPGYFYCNDNALATLLTEADNAELAALTDAALTALAARDLAALRAVHLRVGDALVAHGKAACAALGVDCPISDAGEREVRALIEASWPATG